MRVVPFPVCCGAYFFRSVTDEDIKIMKTDIAACKSSHKAMVPFYEHFPKLAYRLTVLTETEEKAYGWRLVELGFKLLSVAGKGSDRKWLYSWSRKPVNAS